jgi:hypothetical protein
MIHSIPKGRKQANSNQNNRSVLENQDNSSIKANIQKQKNKQSKHTPNYLRTIPTLRLLIPCSKLPFLRLPLSAGDDKPNFKLVALAFFFASNENAAPTAGILNRRIHPFGFSGRSKIGGSGGRKS